MTNALLGKNIIITGSSRGLGARIAHAMWHNGANLLLVARSEEGLRKVHSELMASGQGAISVRTIAVDLRMWDAIHRIVGEARKVWDKIDVLVNNAAVLGPIGPSWENNREEWEATIRVDLLAPVELCQACVPWMIEQRQGKIINLSGGGATSPRPNLSAYATAKAGLVRFSEVLALELRDRNIQVNCVAPGAMNTEIHRAVLRAGPERAGAAEYAQSVRTLEEDGASLQRAADLCVFLASSASSGITGRLISAAWDPWESLPEHVDALKDSDIYTLRRIVPNDRCKDWQ
jgi:NAD(P)-dependent dehydrogenase (short-subunit alcohol dehydrogenase family)